MPSLALHLDASSPDPSSSLQAFLQVSYPSSRFAWNATTPATLTYARKTGLRGRPRWYTVDMPKELCDYLSEQRDSVQCEIVVEEA